MASTNLGERKTSVIILPLQNNIQPYQFNFIPLMHRHTAFKIKTVNMDCDIFTQEKIHLNRYTAPLIRTLTQRKNRELRRGREQSLKRVEGEGEAEKIGDTMENSPDKVETDVNELYLNLREDNNDFLKRHTKTNPSSHKKQSQTERRPHFKRYNHSHSHSIQAKHEDPELFFESFHRGNEDQSQQPKQQQHDSPPRPEDRLKVNPYTKDQYIYMRNRQLDELMQMRRSGKLTRMNSITKSYRVAAISLTPQTSRRNSSLRTAMPAIPNRSRNSPFANPNFPRSTKKQSEIKPWEWAGPQESKQYLI